MAKFILIEDDGTRTELQGALVNIAWDELVIDEISGPKSADAGGVSLTFQYVTRKRNKPDE